MGRTFATILTTLLVVLILLIGAGLLYMHSGMYNVAATDEHVGLVQVGEELVPEAPALVGALDYARNISHDERLEFVHVHDSQIGGQCRERIPGNFGMCGRDR